MLRIFFTGETIPPFGNSGFRQTPFGGESGESIRTLSLVEILSQYQQCLNSNTKVRKNLDRKVIVLEIKIIVIFCLPHKAIMRQMVIDTMTFVSIQLTLHR